MFKVELAALKGKKPVWGALRALNPFVDEQEVLRVGGRLEKSLQQIQQISAYLRTRYWIFNMKRNIKQSVHNCNICYRGEALPTTKG